MVPGGVLAALHQADLGEVEQGAYLPILVPGFAGDTVGALRPLIGLFPSALALPQFAPDQRHPRSQQPMLQARHLRVEVLEESLGLGIAAAS